MESSVMWIRGGRGEDVLGFSRVGSLFVVIS